jgi:hypothetical protein
VSTVPSDLDPEVAELLNRIAHRIVAGDTELLAQIRLLDFGGLSAHDAGYADGLAQRPTQPATEPAVVPDHVGGYRIAGQTRRRSIGGVS